MHAVGRLSLNCSVDTYEVRREGARWLYGNAGEVEVYRMRAKRSSFRTSGESGVGQTHSFW